ncbi:hypothetical protein [Jiella sp. M17.18]|uniref:hypothetical protein n=1 Tax=Jiella sp. M17.18 TaxID=3234247 RepID=UPI0034DF3CAE
MSIDQQGLGLDQTAQALAAPTAATAGMHPLQQAALRLGEARDGRSRLKAKELVGLLLSYGARAWRASQPISHSRIRVGTPNGMPAVRMRFR